MVDTTESTGCTASFEAHLALAKEAALKGGEIIRSYHSSDGAGRANNSAVVSVKSGVDLVTEADTRVEKMILDMIRTKFPKDTIVGEEGFAESPTGEQDEAFPMGAVWCVDPIDGTTNFVHGYPFVAVSIGFCVDRVPVVGVIYNPFTDCMYEAYQGSKTGTLLNGRPVRVDAVASTVEDCLLVNNIGHYRAEAFVDESAERVRKWLRAGLRGYRAAGSAAQNLAHASSGQVSAYYEHGFGGPWDVVAGAVLVREAGGVVKDPRTGEDLVPHFGKGSVCAGPAKVVEDVLRVAGKPTFIFD